jgi:hypothetical protein
MALGAGAGWLRTRQRDLSVCTDFLFSSIESPSDCVVRRMLFSDNAFWGMMS